MWGMSVKAGAPDRVTSSNRKVGWRIGIAKLSVVTKLFFVIVVAVVLSAAGCAEDLAAKTTRVVVLGTGNPAADPERWGPAVAVLVNDRSYLIDCGPGVVRRAAAAEKNGVAALKPKELSIVFITHLHSDHTLGYPDLI